MFNLFLLLVLDVLARFRCCVDSLSLLLSTESICFLFFPLAFSWKNLMEIHSQSVKLISNGIQQISMLVWLIALRLRMMLKKYRLKHIEIDVYLFLDNKIVPFDAVTCLMFCLKNHKSENKMRTNSYFLFSLCSHFFFFFEIDSEIIFRC